MQGGISPLVRLSREWVLGLERLFSSEAAHPSEHMFKFCSLVLVVAVARFRPPVRENPSVAVARHGGRPSKQFSSTHLMFARLANTRSFRVHVFKDRTLWAESSPAQEVGLKG